MALILLSWHGTHEYKLLWGWHFRSRCVVFEGLLQSDKHCSCFFLATRQVLTVFHDVFKLYYSSDICVRLIIFGFYFFLTLILVGFFSKCSNLSKTDQSEGQSYPNPIRAYYIHQSISPNDLQMSE